MTFNPGQQVTASNANGARYSGVVKALRGDGQVIVRCSQIDIGYGWEPHEVIEIFEPEQIEDLSFDPLPIAAVARG